MPDHSASRLSVNRFIPLGVLILAGALFIGFGGHRYLSLAALADNREWLQNFVALGGIGAVLAFILVYAGLVTLSVPVAALLSITSGFLFGPWLGAICAVIGATLGATIVFLAVRAGSAGRVERAGERLRRRGAGFGG